MSILKTFLGVTCPACEGTKMPNTAFCIACYRTLPKPMQRNLWKRFGAGFDGAFEEAFYWLKTQQKPKVQKSLF